MNLSTPFFIVSHTEPATLVAVSQILDQKPVPLANAPRSTPISMASSLALMTSEPAGKRYSTLRPCGKNDLPLGKITISWLLVSGLS